MSVMIFALALAALVIATGAASYDERHEPLIGIYAAVGFMALFGVW